MRMWQIIRILLLLKVISIQGNLIGDHICTTEETFLVNVTETYLKNTILRNYKWCLNVPPRCSFYTNKQVTDTRVVEKNDTRVVEVCCPGFVEKSNKCVSKCPVCKNGACEDGVCVCSSGYKGNACDLECSSVEWGLNCSKTCNCNKCDPKTGICPEENTTHMTKETTYVSKPITRASSTLFDFSSTLSTRITTPVTKSTRDDIHIPIFSTSFAEKDYSTHPSVITSSSTEESLTHFTFVSLEETESSIYTKQIIDPIVLNSPSSSKFPVPTTNAPETKNTIGTTTIKNSNKLIIPKVISNPTVLNILSTSKHPNVATTKIPEEAGNNKHTITNQNWDDLIIPIFHTTSTDSTSPTFSRTETADFIPSDNGNQQRGLTTTREKSTFATKPYNFSKTPIATKEGLLIPVEIQYEQTQKDKNQVLTSNEEYYNRQISNNFSSNDFTLFGITILMALMLVVTILSINFLRKKRKIKNNKHQVAVFSASIFHSPLPDPPVTENPLYLNPVKCQNGLKEPSFETTILCNVNGSHSPSKDSKEFEYDHPPSTGSYRAAPSVDPDTKRNYVIEPLYDEIPQKEYDQNTPTTSTFSSPMSIYINTCGRTKF